MDSSFGPRSYNQFYTILLTEQGLTNLTQGDIAPDLEPGPDDHTRRRRAAIRNRNRLWPGGIVPYTFHYSVSK